MKETYEIMEMQVCKKEKHRQILRDKRRVTYYLAYTALAAAFFGGIIAVFSSNGKALVWKSDGIRQHYTTLAYYGTYLRTLLKNLFIEHKWKIPMWDLHIGYGTDILTTLHYYGIGDPVTLLSVFVPQQQTEYLFEFLILLRIYLAGVTFSEYCFYHKNARTQVLLGSLMYISSQWILWAGFRHPYFINPCIYLPLLLLGVDKIFLERKPYLYIFSIAVAAMSSFYFFYMLGIITVIYAVFRYFMLYRKWNFKIIRKLLGDFCLYSIVGVFLAGVILLPVIMAVLGTGRMSVEHLFPILYKQSFYMSLPSALFGEHLSRYTTVGVASVGFLTLVVLFIKGKKYRALQGAAVLLILMLCIPYVGHVMNGFSYATNRWSWSVVMLLSYVFVKMYPELFCLTGKERLLASAVIGIYVVYTCSCSAVNSSGNVASAVILAVAGALVLCTGRKAS